VNENSGNVSGELDFDLIVRYMLTSAETDAQIMYTDINYAGKTYCFEDLDQIDSNRFIEMRS
jgi:hypothetical protein